MKRCLSWCLATLALLVLTACSTPTAVADTDDFRWMGTVVAGLSETGEQAEELVIPASATEVSLDLTGNTVLRRLSFESDDTVIRNLILEDCTALEEVVFPASVEEIGNCSGCTSLTQVTIPEGVTTISGSAFYGCTSLKTVVMPESVREIGVYAFSGCSGLESVTLPPNLTQIPDGAFYQCSSLGEVQVPEGVTSIGSSAFDECASLSAVSLPESLNVLKDAAFMDCTALTTITIPANVSEIDHTAFMKREGEQVAFYVREGSWADLNSVKYCLSGDLTTY